LKRVPVVVEVVVEGLLSCSRQRERGREGERERERERVVEGLFSCSRQLFHLVCFIACLGACRLLVLSSLLFVVVRLVAESERERERERK
jgi:hypothetical protein